MIETIILASFVGWPIVFLLYLLQAIFIAYINKDS